MPLSIDTSAPALPDWPSVSPAKGGENIQMKVSRIVERLFQTLSDLSLNEQEKIALLKKDIKKLADTQANATSWQGWIALGTAIVGGVFVGASFFTPNKHMQKTLPTVGGLISDSSAKFLNSRQDMTITLSSSQRELLMRALDQATSDIQSKSQSRREFSDVLKEILQTAQNASRAG